MFELDDMERALFEYIKSMKNVSYVELELYFQEIGFSYQGNVTRYSAENPNVFLWGGWNEEAFNLVQSLEDKKLIIKQSFSTLEKAMLVYHEFPSQSPTSSPYPIAKNLNYPYKQKHWLPVVYIPLKR